MKIIRLWCLIAQMKRQDTLIATQKTSTLSDVPLLKKSRKIPQNGHFWKNGHFWEFFLIFSATVHRTELRFFALQSVRPGASFKLSNTPKQWFSFFRLKWGFSNFQTPRTGGVLKKNSIFFGIFLTSMYRSSVLACSKHHFPRYQHPSKRLDRSILG